MTPYYFRGSVLISEGILSFTEFMTMTVGDFQKLEAFIVFKNEYRKSREKKAKNEQAGVRVSALPALNVKDLGFTEEQLKGLYDGNN